MSQSMLIWRTEHGAFAYLLYNAKSWTPRLEIATGAPWLQYKLASTLETSLQHGTINLHLNYTPVRWGNTYAAIGWWTLMSSLQQVAQTWVFTPWWQALWARWRETEWGLEIKIGAIVYGKSTPITTIISSKPLYFYHPYVSCRCEPINNHISSTVTHAHTRVMLQFHPG